MKTLLSFFLIILSSSLTNAQTTAIPDANFEQALIDLGYDNVIDGIILTANTDTVTFLNVGYSNISDLTGIEDFTALTELYCYHNQLISLDITQNTTLTKLHCSNNLITSLDVSQNTALIELHCSNNLITNLDIIQNTALTELYCYSNLLTSLDVTPNTDLTNLRCANNQLTSLDINQNTALTTLSCFDNNLISLDVSQNMALTILGCFNNQLTCLSVKNGNNANLTDFWIYNNPNLNCIEVDNATWATTNWTVSNGNIDSQSSFSTNCPSPCTVGIKENNISNLSLYPNPTNGTVTIDLEEVKQRVKATLTNSLGQFILTETFISTNFIILDIDSPSGIYFLQLEEANGETRTIKILKN